MSMCIPFIYSIFVTYRSLNSFETVRHHSHRPGAGGFSLEFLENIVNNVADQDGIVVANLLA